MSETRAGQAKSYVYNSQNQLISATINGQQHQFGYDINGIRQRKISNGQVTAYVVDHNQAYAQVVAEYANNGVTRYTYGNDLIRQQRSSGNATQSHSYLYDGLGSTKALADATGTITDSYAYDAYGEIIASSGSTANSYKYAGEQYDTDLGMYYNRARYYNQSIGRFSQMDSWQGHANNPITLNKYVYANASPTIYTDPSGNFGISQVGAGLFIVNTLTSMQIDNGLNILENRGVDVSDARIANYAFGLVNLGGAGYNLFKSFSKSGRAFAAKVGATKKVKDLEGTELDDYLNSLGGRSAFMMGIPGVRKVEFDGAWGNIWYEAKTMDYFAKAAAGTDEWSKFIKKMRDAKRIAESDVHRATFVVITNVAIHPKCRAKLDELGIKYVEML